MSKSPKALAPFLADTRGSALNVNLTQALQDHALRQPSRLAFSCGDWSCTYSELEALVVRTAAWLYERGVIPPCTVAYALAPIQAQLLVMLALMRMGATAMPISPKTSAAQLQTFTGHAGVQWFLSDTDWQDMPTACPIMAFDAQMLSLTTPWSTETLHDKKPAAPALLVTGSGSTGEPKLIPITHAQMRVRFALLQQCYGLRDDDRVMVLAALYLATPCYRILAALDRGATGVVWDPDEPLDRALARMAPDVLHLSVFHAEKLLEFKSSGFEVDLSKTRVVSIGASTIRQQLRQRLQNDLNARLHINYGTNETLTVCYAYPQDLAQAPGVVGRPPAGVTVEVVDEHDHPVSTGQVGRVRVQSPAQIDGYLGGQNSGHFLDGWFYPGDLAHWTPDGQLVHCGRSDSMMIFNGINIYPIEIEKVLQHNPAVDDVVALGLPHPVAQDVPVCLVVVRPGVRVSSHALLQYARSQLGAKAPHEVLIVPEIPRNEQGKPVRSRLLEMAQQALATRQHAMALPWAHQVHGQRRQLLQRLQLSMPAVELGPVQHLARWRQALSDPHGPFNPSPALPEHVRAHKSSAAIQEGLLLAQQFLLAVRVPVFAAIRLVAIRQRHDDRKARSVIWQLAIEAPILNMADTVIYQRAVASAFAWAQGLKNNPQFDPGRPDDLQRCWDQLHRETLPALRGLVPPGKSTLHLLRACYEAGIPFSHEVAGVYRLGWGAKSRRVDRSTTDRDAAMGQRLTQNKFLTAQLLRLAGLPTPDHRLVRRAESAVRAAAALGGAVVIKPVDAERGEGVHLDVQPADVAAAFEKAKARSGTSQVLVERFVQGVCHRFFVAQGRLLYAVKRGPAGVYGDGVQTIEQLLARLQARQRQVPPWRREPILGLDDKAMALLQELGLNAQSVPPAGQFVPFRQIESTADGGVDEDVSTTAHPENVRAALAAARLCGLEVAGVDIISTDITQPWYVNAAVINEVNYAPLLGGGDVSRARIGDFLRSLLPTGGRIPVKVYVGDSQALGAAQAQAAAWRQQGHAVALTNDHYTERPDGSVWRMTAQGLYARTRALVASPEVQVLLLVIHNDEFLRRGLPLEGIDALEICNESLSVVQSPAISAPTASLLALLRAWIWPKQGVTTRTT